MVLLVPLLLLLLRILHGPAASGLGVLPAGAAARFGAAAGRVVGVVVRVIEPFHAPDHVHLGVLVIP